MNQEDSEQNELDGMKKGADSRGKVMHKAYVKEQLVICNEEDTAGLARVTTDQERVLYLCRLNTDKIVYRYTVVTSQVGW